MSARGPSNLSSYAAEGKMASAEKPSKLQNDVDHELLPGEDAKDAAEIISKAKYPSASELKRLKQSGKISTLPSKPLHEFLWTDSPHPHAVRRRMILQKYPEIEELYGADPNQAFMMVIGVFLQYVMCALVGRLDPSIGVLIVLSYAVSATLNHSCFCALHEASHRTVFEERYASELLCLFVNMPLGLPAAIPFKRYHLDHHIYMGVNILDPDLPTPFEANLVQSTFSKFVFITLIPFLYSLRPMITRPKAFQFMDGLCWITTFGSDALVWYCFGTKALLYLFLGTFFAFNFHIFAGHFLTEHYIFNDKPGVTDVYQETYSYYGWANLLSYNLGFHNEHHDFPRIPGSRLPIVTDVAKEFYAIPAQDSWSMPVWRFIFRDRVNAFSRVKRTAVEGGHLNASQTKAKQHEDQIPGGGPYRFWPAVKNIRE